MIKKSRLLFGISLLFFGIFFFSGLIGWIAYSFVWMDSCFNTMEIICLIIYLVLKYFFVIGVGGQLFSEIDS